MKQIISPIIILTLFIIIIISTRVPNIESKSPIKDPANFKFYNVTISMHKNGEKIWTLTAKESSIYNESETFYLVDIDGQLLGKNHNNLSFKSPAGAYKMKQQVLKLVKTDSNLKILDQNYFIICDEIEINSKESIVSAYGNLLINSDTLLLKGRKMIADLAKSKLYLSHDIEGSIITAPIN